MLGAVDLGGTYVKCALFNQNLEEIDYWKFSLPETLDVLVNKLLETFQRHCESKGKLALMSIAVAGFIDEKNQLIETSPNISFLKLIPLGKIISERAGVAVYLINDANAAALGAYHRQKLKKSPFIYLTIGTGLGSGLIINEQLMSGHKGFASELGHFRINPDGRECGCGARGCAETEISATALLKNYYQFSQRKPQGVEELIKSAQKGDRFALESFERFNYFLGNFLSSLLYTFNPAQIVLGGGVSRAADFFLPRVTQIVAGSTASCFVKNCSIKAEESASEVGLLGAALYAKRIINERDS